MRQRNALSEDWRAALAEWLETSSEAARARAYELGRRALSEGMGLVALSELHARAVQALLDRPAGEMGVRDAVHRAWQFLAEALSPSELALRGYRDTVSQLQNLNRSLAARVEQRSRALVSAETQYRTLIDHLPVVTYTAKTSAMARMTFVSPQIEAVTGYAPGEWLELPGRWGGCLHPDDREQVEAELARTVRLGVSFRAEYRIVRKDGRIAWVRDEARIAKPGLHQGVWLDVTGMRALEEELRQAQKLDAIGRLAGGVAHDFNNILTAILSFSRFIHEDLGAGHPSLPDVEEVLRSAERGAALTRQLLAFSRSRAFQMQPVDLNALARGMERMLSRLLGERISLRLELDEMLHEVYADPSQVEQIVLNLVVNAGDAIAGAGEVRIKTRNVSVDAESSGGLLGARLGEYAELTVSDTGSGMDPETQRRIFEPFFTSKAPGKGTGLGLTTVFGIVRQTGGEIEVHSAPGQGTTFRVLLPRSLEHESHEEGPAVACAATEGHSVLLVEDDEAVRTVAARALRDAGFEVLEAEGPEQARAHAGEAGRRIDVVLVDIVLGTDLGPSVAEEVSALHPDTCVLYMSGYAEPDLMRAGVALENAAVLEKPFTPARLTEFVRNALDSTRRA